MRTKSAFVVLALAGAAVIGVAMTAQDAKAGPAGHVASAANVALAKPPGKSSSFYSKNSYRSRYFSRYSCYYNGCYSCYPTCYTYCPPPVVVTTYVPPPVVVEVVPVCVQPVCCYNTCSYPCYGSTPQFASRYSNYSHYNGSRGKSK